MIDAYKLEEVIDEISKEMDIPCKEIRDIANQLFLSLSIPVNDEFDSAEIIVTVGGEEVMKKNITGEDIASRAYSIKKTTEKSWPGSIVTCNFY